MLLTREIAIEMLKNSGFTLTESENGTRINVTHAASGDKLLGCITSYDISILPSCIDSDPRSSRWILFDEDAKQEKLQTVINCLRDSFEELQEELKRLRLNNVRDYFEQRKNESERSYG